MKIRELQEGFLDDLTAAMRGADTFTGFLKNLSGGSAKLDQISRKIFQDAERVLISGQTNLRQPGISDSDIPMDRLIVAVFNAAAEFSKTSKNPVSRQDLLAHFKKHQAEIIKGMNRQSRGANLAPAGAAEVNKLVSKQPTAAIPGAGLDGNLEAISVLAALTLLDMEFRRATDQGNSASANFEFSREDLQDFQTRGEEILEALFSPGSDLHRALKINQGFKENMKKFVEQLFDQVNKEFANADTEQLKARAERIDQVVQPLELRSALVGHIDFNDADLPDGYQRAVAEMLAKRKNSFDDFLAAWAALALKEREATGSPISQEAQSILSNWADRALRLLDSLKFAAPKAKQPQQAGKKIGQAGRQNPNAEEEAHQFASDQVAKLKPGPGESPDQLANRAGREYQRAFADYFERNPPQ